MYYEQRLISIGWPFDEAFGICRALRREGGLKEFVEEQEKEYRLANLKFVEEVLLHG